LHYKSPGGGWGWTEDKEMILFFEHDVDEYDIMIFIRQYNLRTRSKGRERKEWSVKTKAAAHQRR